jgi:hypothetical protein
MHGQRGGIVFFQVGSREIGHLHGSRFADLPFPVRIREEVSEGKADLHYLHPRSGWVTYHINGQGDFEPIVELFRLNYGRPWLKANAIRDRQRSGDDPGPQETPQV